MDSYYSKNKAAYQEYYKQRRLDKLAYQKEYTTRRKAAGWVPKKYVRKSRAIHRTKPDVKVIIVKVEDEPEVPEPKAQRSRAVQKKQPLVWKEASFSMTLD
jgi:hypothetical protein